MADDIKVVAAKALAMAPALLPEWMGGGREGREWKAARTHTGGIGDSWSISLDTGKWLHGAGDERGGDMVSLYSALHKIDMGAALKEVARIIGANPDVYVPVLPHVKPPEKPPEAIPFDAVAVPPHKEYGPATATYRYGDSFAIARYDHPGGKEFKQFTWRDDRWQAKAAPAPRELYHRIELDKNPHARVLVVEGEKCVEAARHVLQAWVLLTWAGGAGAVKKNDWAVLAGRDVSIWPDADEPGRTAAAELAAILLPIAKQVRIIEPPEDKPPGWDIADAIADGWSRRQVAEFIASPATKAVTAAKEKPPESRIEASDTDESAVVNWQSLGLDCNQGGVPHPTMANASLIVQMHPGLKGRIWLDTFRGRIFHTLRGAVQSWTDADTRRLTVLVQQQLRLPKVTTRIMIEAIDHAAEVNAKNSLTEWLDSLVWDETPRLDMWLTDCLGVDFDEYTHAIARNWPIGMVARAYRPGCKMDNMPVLEGVSGLSKTTFLEVLGDPWYKSLSIAFGDKDFLQAIQGAWLVEIPDMTGFSRREQSHILATITTRTDSYRASYGRYVEEHPRTTVFAATSETDDYLQDHRGKRRYWPLRCESIDIDALRQQRDQIFAEAVQCYRKGEIWYKVPVQAVREQEQRAERDIWTDKVLDYCDLAQDLTGRIRIEGVLTSGLDIPISKQTGAEARRVTRILREAGWVRTRDTHARYWRKMPNA